MELGYRPRPPQHRPVFGSGGSEKSLAVEGELANRRRAGGPLRLELLHDLPTEALPVHGADAWRGVGRKGGRATPRERRGEGPIHLNLSVPSLALPDPPAPEGGRGGGTQARRTGRAEERRAFSPPLGPRTSTQRGQCLWRGWLPPRIRPPLGGPRGSRGPLLPWTAEAGSRALPRMPLSPRQCCCSSPGHAAWG